MSLRSSSLQPPGRTLHEYSSQGLAVPRAGDKSYVTGFIPGWSRSRSTYVPGGCWLEQHKLTCSLSQFQSYPVSLKYLKNCFIGDWLNFLPNITRRHQLSTVFKKTSRPSTPFLISLQHHTIMFVKSSTPVCFSRPKNSLRCCLPRHFAIQAWPLRN